MVVVGQWSRPTAVSPSLYIPLLSLGPHRPPAHIVSGNASWQVTPVASWSGSLWILIINLLTLTGFATADCFRQWTILKWPHEVDSLNVMLPVHGFDVLYIRYLSCYLLIQRILWGRTAWCSLIICSSCPVPPGQSTAYRTLPVSPEGWCSDDWTQALPCLGLFTVCMNGQQHDKGDSTTPKPSQK